jgi:hypothetical protein
MIPVGRLPIGIAVPDDRVAHAANMAEDTIGHRHQTWRCRAYRSGLRRP